MSKLFPPDYRRPALAGHPYDDEPLILEDLHATGDPDPDAPDAPPAAQLEPIVYPAADYLCLRCPVVPDCNSKSHLCLRRRAAQHERRQGDALRRLLAAVRYLQGTNVRVTSGALAARLNRTRSGIYPRIQDALARGLIARDSPRGRLYLTPAGARYLDRSSG